MKKFDAVMKEKEDKHLETLKETKVKYDVEIENLRLHYTTLLEEAKERRKRLDKNTVSSRQRRLQNYGKKQSA